MKISKSRLGIELSKFKVFENPKVREEQYITDSEIAAEVLWNAYLLDDIYGKVSVDLGAGTGILGLGAALLGAKKVYLVENDSSAVKIAKSNYKMLDYIGKSESSGEGNRNSGVYFFNIDINKFNIKCDTVLQNPPFGTKVRHSDRVFLEKAVTLAKVVYSFHKSESKAFVEAFAKDNGFRVSHVWDFDFPLKVSMRHHRKPVRKVKVSCFRLESI